MRAAIFKEMSKPLVIETVADPVPGAHDLILKVKNCGICGSRPAHDRTDLDHAAARWVASWATNSPAK